MENMPSIVDGGGSVTVRCLAKTIRLSEKHKVCCAHFFSSLHDFSFALSLHLIQRPHDKESILWQITCDWILIHAQFLSYWIIRCVLSPALTHTQLSLFCFQSRQRRWRKPFFDYVYHIYFIGIFSFFCLPVANGFVSIHECDWELSIFTGSNFKFCRFSFHLYTRAAAVLTWAWLCNCTIFIARSRVVNKLRAN